MITIQLNNRRVDIEKDKKGYYGYHCYILIDTIPIYYIFKNNLWSALKFILYL